MLLFDALVRCGAVTLLLTSAFFCFRDGGKLIQTQLGAWTGIIVAALLLSTAPEPLRLPEPLFTVFRILDIPNLAVIWLFARSLFVDDFKFGRLEWVVSTFYIALVSLLRFGNLEWLHNIPPFFLHSATFLSAVMVAHIIWTALAGRSDDLLEARRRGRPWFSVGLAIACSTTIIAETIYGSLDGGVNSVVSTVRATVTLPMAAWGVIWLMKLHPENILFERAQPMQVKAPEIDPRDAALHRKLTALMNEDHFYKEQGLTIRILAEKLGAPEHHLRALINQSLGFRNFAAFLNHYRIAYAKDVLSDIEQARLPVLTIAMDAGFNSLAPFNRAFKSMESITPTDYRRQALSRTEPS